MPFSWSADFDEEKVSGRRRPTGLGSEKRRGERRLRQGESDGMVTVGGTLQTTVEWYQELDRHIPWERSSQLSDLRRCVALHIAAASCPRLPRLVLANLLPARLSVCVLE